MPTQERSAATTFGSARFPLDPVLVAAGAGVVTRSLRRGRRGWKRYRGDAREICRAVLEDCWTGEYLAGSAGHFRQFWVRDLAMCTPALVRLGMQDRVLRSLSWALERFERADAITTTIFARRFPRDVYDYACDSLPMLLFALQEAGGHELLVRHRSLLTREANRYVRRVLDPDLGLARPVGYFSAPRDCIAGRSTTFANVMLALLARQLVAEPALPDVLAGHDIPRRLRESHWTGSFFRDALDCDEPSGDANVWPFFFGLYDDRPEMQRLAFATLEQRGFNEPIPLRYFERRLPERELPVPRLFTPNYQGDTIWMQLGPVYLSLLRNVDLGRMSELRDRLYRLIERDGNVLELYDHVGRRRALPSHDDDLQLQPYVGRAGLYRADEGMIWAALILDLER